MGGGAGTARRFPPGKTGMRQMTETQPKASHFIDGRYVEDTNGAPIEVISVAVVRAKTRGGDAARGLGGGRRGREELLVAPGVGQPAHRRRA